VVAGWYYLLALFPAAAENRRIVADLDNHGTLSPSCARTCSTSRV